MNRSDILQARFFESQLDSGEAAELARSLENDEAFAREFLGLYTVDRLLSVKFGPRRSDVVRTVLDAIEREQAPFVREVVREIQRAPGTVSCPQREWWRVLAGRFGWQRWAISAAAMILLFLGLGVWLFGPVIGEPALAEIAGGVRFERAGQSVVATRGARLLLGDVVRTDTNVTAAILFGAERTRFHLGVGTELRLTPLASGKQFELRLGRLEADVARQRPFAPLVITTPNAEARVVGTKFTLTATTNRTRLEVAEGTVRLVGSAVTNEGASVKVNAGHYAVVAAATELAALPGTGGLLREQWFGLNKEAMDMLPFNLRFPGKPDGSGRWAQFEFVETRTNNCVTRLRGYLHPPVTGEYKFWMASANPAYLFLSRSGSPQDMQAELSTGGQAFREWDYVKQPGDGGRLRSLSIPLTAGRRYYVEVVMTAPAGEAHLSIAWQPPGGQRETIRGEFLSPFELAK